MNMKSMGRRRFMQKSVAGAVALEGIRRDGGNEAVAAESAGGKTWIDRRNRRGAYTLKPGKRPHIFFVSADMVSPDCYLPSRAISGHLNLPHIRSIGEGGTRFDNALCASPLCGPSRASIFTGKYPPFLINNERALAGMKYDLAEEDTIFQEYLRSAGYSTKHVGKCHVGTMKFMAAFGENDTPWDRWSPPVMEDDGYVEYLRGLGVEAPVVTRELRGKGKDRKSPGNAYGGWISQKNGKPFPLDAHYSVYLARKAVNKLDAALKQHPSAPVYIQLDFFDPHQPFSIPSEFESRAAELRKLVSLPESYQKMLATDFKALPGDPPIYDLYRHYWGAYDPELVKEYMVCNYLQMEIVDHCVGILLDAIKQRGIWDDSLIIYMSDHGEMNGRLGFFDKGVYFQPEVFRIPLGIKAPASFRQSRRVYEKPVSSLDVCPTILGFAGIGTDETYDGEDLRPVLSGAADRPVLEQVFQAGWHVGVNYGVGFQLYDDPGHHWFYGYNIAGGEEELYNMSESDPVNLFHDPRHENLRRRMVEKVGGILSADERWFGYWSTYRIHHGELLKNASGDMQMGAPRK
jgi:arylsulfatase A-like enzyme